MQVAVRGFPDSLSPSVFAVITAVPCATAVTLPFSSTVATDGLELIQVTVLLTASSFTVAVIFSVIAFFGVTPNVLVGVERVSVFYQDQGLLQFLQQGL